ncbi:DUF6301 family protein [Spirillospora sp. NBC_01491]|uniref:DUF6301 family protein n=1 Tax=Spirillospora sp. NBC_01491 TaxID=2976007 RepID=UPI002E300ADD|nr:hypothetical protein [Spirillospora sp. NBC_01491]
MIVSARLLDDQMDDLIRSFSTLDLGGWQRPDIERVLAERGWSLVEDRGVSLGFSTGLPTGHGYASTDLDHSPALAVTLASGLDHAEAVEVFDTARRQAEDVLGPPPLRGGPGPWLRWRRPGATPRLRLARACSDEATASVHLELLATDRYEHHEVRTARHQGEHPYSWCRTVHTDETDGMLVPGDAVAEDWRDVEDRLARTLRALVRDVPVLGEDPLTLVIEERDDGSRMPSEIPTCFVKLADGVLRVECPADPVPDMVLTLTELGWTAPSEAWITVLTTGDWSTEPDGSPSFSRDWPLTSEVAAGDAARLVVGALRAVEATLPALGYWVGRNGDNLGVRLPELGI